MAIEYGLHDISTSGSITALSGIFTNLTINNATFTEAVQDVIGGSGFLVGASGITIFYNDTANTLTITASSTSGEVSGISNETSIMNALIFG
jgi:hypothetical protein